MTPDQLQRLETLERDFRDHDHDGLGTRRVNLRDVFGKIEIVSVAPVGKPTNIGAQFKIYKNSTTLRLYWYDTTEGAWHYVTATA